MLGVVFSPLSNIEVVESSVFVHDLLPHCIRPRQLDAYLFILHKMSVGSLLQKGAGILP